MSVQCHRMVFCWNNCTILCTIIGWADRFKNTLPGLKNDPINLGHIQISGSWLFFLAVYWVLKFNCAMFKRTCTSLHSIYFINISHWQFWWRIFPRTMMIMSTTPFWKSARVWGGGQGSKAKRRHSHRDINLSILHTYIFTNKHY